LILEDVIRFLWGGMPITADMVMDAAAHRIGGFLYGYNLWSSALARLPPGRRAGSPPKFGAAGATSQDRRMASRPASMSGWSASAFSIGLRWPWRRHHRSSQAAVLGMASMR
jgi:hypothetical protein